eukprot:m.166244 g.166244  ORF g.166244 m.166244 type:complete len:56 (-) comp13444_c1_seq10:1843-2010(-)
MQSFTAAQGHLHSHVEEEERILDALKEKVSLCLSACVFIICVVHFVCLLFLFNCL